MEKKYNGPERRKFLRLEFVTPLGYKVCKQETITKLLEGYTSDVSQSGVLCNLKDKVSKGDILWLSFDRSTLTICHDIESKGFIYQNGIIGKVARIESKSDSTYNVGVQFITREETNQSNIYPKIYFVDKQEEDGKN